MAEPQPPKNVTEENCVCCDELIVYALSPDIYIYIYINIYIERGEI